MKLISLPSQTLIDDDDFAKVLSVDLMCIRNTLKITQNTMAANFDVSPRQYKRWESDGVKVPTLNFWVTLHRLIIQYVTVAQKVNINEKTFDLARFVNSKIKMISGKSSFIYLAK